MYKLLNSLSNFCLLVIIPLITYLTFPIIGLRCSYLIVLFYLSLIKFHNIHSPEMLLSSVFIDAINWNMLGMTYIYSIIMVYIYCDYVNLVCIISRSFIVVWSYFALLVVISAFMYCMIMTLSGLDFEYSILARKMVASLLIFPLIAGTLGVLIKNEA